MIIFSSGLMLSTVSLVLMRSPWHLFDLIHFRYYFAVYHFFVCQNKFISLSLFVQDCSHSCVDELHSSTSVINWRKHMSNDGLMGWWLILISYIYEWLLFEHTMTWMIIITQQISDITWAIVGAHRIHTIVFTIIISSVRTFINVCNSKV